MTEGYCPHSRTVVGPPRCQHASRAARLAAPAAGCSDPDSPALHCTGRRPSMTGTMSMTMTDRHLCRRPQRGGAGRDEGRKRRAGKFAAREGARLTAPLTAKRAYRSDTVLCSAEGAPVPTRSASAFQDCCHRELRIMRSLCPLCRGAQRSIMGDPPLAGSRLVGISRKNRIV